MMDAEYLKFIYTFITAFAGAYAAIKVELAVTKVMAERGVKEAERANRRIEDHITNCHVKGIHHG